MSEVNKEDKADQLLSEIYATVDLKINYFHNRLIKTLKEKARESKSYNEFLYMLKQTIRETIAEVEKEREAFHWTIGQIRYDYKVEIVNPSDNEHPYDRFNVDYIQRYFYVERDTSVNYKRYKITFRDGVKIARKNIYKIVYDGIAPEGEIAKFLFDKADINNHFNDCSMIINKTKTCMEVLIVLEPGMKITQENIREYIFNSILKPEVTILKYDDECVLTPYGNFDLYLPDPLLYKLYISNRDVL